MAGGKLVSPMERLRASHPQLATQLEEARSDPTQHLHTAMRNYNPRGAAAALARALDVNAYFQPRWIAAGTRCFAPRMTPLGILLRSYEYNNRANNTFRTDGLASYLLLQVRLPGVRFSPDREAARAKRKLARRRRATAAIAALLFAFGADVHLPTTPRGETPLRMAAGFSNPVWAQLLLDEGADVATDLALGIEWCHVTPTVGALLFAYGASVFARNTVALSATDMSICRAAIANGAFGRRHHALQWWFWWH